MKAAGIKHVAFKPGSADSIRQAVSITATNPDFPAIVHWTDGRAGGHHFYEDFYQPILATYRSIRQHGVWMRLMVGCAFLEIGLSAMGFSQCNSIEFFSLAG